MLMLSAESMSRTTTMTRNGQMICNKRPPPGRDSRIRSHVVLLSTVLVVAIRSITCHPVRQDLIYEIFRIGRQTTRFPPPRIKESRVLFSLSDLYVNSSVNGNLWAIL